MLLFNENNNFEQTQFWTVGVESLRFYLDLWRGMLCKIENDFYSLVAFQCEYLRTQKLGNFVFYIKTTRLTRHSFEKWVCSVFKFAYFKRWVVRKIENGFYWLIYFHCDYLKLKNSKMLIFKENNAFQQTQFWTVGVASLTFYLDIWRGMLCKIENDFYSLVGFHCEYLRTQKLENLAFYIKQHIWADTVLKNGCVQFLNSLTLRKMGSV